MVATDSRNRRKIRGRREGDGGSRALLYPLFSPVYINGDTFSEEKVLGGVYPAMIFMG